MKTKTLTLNAFGSFAAVSIDMDAPRIFIAGVNGAGKTTIREALKFALLGPGRDPADQVPQWLDPKKDGVNVCLDVEGIGSVTREWVRGSHNLSVSDWDGGLTQQQSGLYEALKLENPAVLAAVLDSSTFFDLHHADAKNLIMELLDVRVQIGEKLFTLAEVEEAYDDAFESRKAAKNALKALGTLTPPVDPDLPTIADVDVRLAELQAQRDALNVSIGRNDGTRETAERALRNRPISRLSMTAEQYTQLCADIETMDERLAMIEADDDGIDEALPTLTDERPSLTKGVSLKTIEGLRAHHPDNGCVLEAGVVCKTHKSLFTKRANELAREMPADAAGVAEPVKKKEPSPTTMMRERLDDLKGKKIIYETQLAAEDAIEADLEKWRTTLDTLPALSKERTTLADVMVRLETGRGIREQRVKYDQALDLHAASLKNQKAKEAAVADLEKEVALYGPDGARATALAECIGAFSDSINKILQPFGWTLKFTVDPWDVLVNGRRIRTFSKSERMRIGVAIQVAIAKQSGLSWVVVDEMDILNQAWRDVLGRLLVHCELDQVIMLTTREPDQKLPDFEGLKAYRLGSVEGHSKIVEGTGVLA